MSAAARVYARVSPRLANRPGAVPFTRAHAWLVRRTGGRIGRRFLGVDTLVLQTTGRKSGEARESPVFFVRHGDGFAVVASNAAADRPPSWWLNLQSDPDAVALVEGEARPVRARRATAEESGALWPRLLEAYRGYDHYRSIATRELPVIVLEPRPAEE